MGKIGHFRNACRTPRSATTHPSSPRVKRHTRSPLRNIEAPPYDEQDVVVVNQLGQEKPTRQGSYTDVKVNDSLVSLFESELAQIIRRESQLAEEMRQLKSQLEDLRERLRANLSDFEENTTESQKVQVEETDKPEKADEADKLQGDTEKVDQQSKPRIQDVEYNDESGDNDKKKNKKKKGRRR